ncbi:histidine phosphatase family protein [Paenibacillus qinlingensis]|uniref:Phosphoglycerate mutase n=1 Tax=Paenibacillus qinlingensis TaxID=1837343 RepID=A0ABU1NSI7_9BACL|nr:histidine phosphatase family protein [Paenibacillus qinlingensis]MDR6549847.1 putative phosphoglycerate mutase [Paenibacillus qinlingensis]
MTVVGLIRHGLTDWNTEKRVQGQTDIPLNAFGRKQAELLSHRMKDEDWDYIYASDLGRAHETASYIANVKQMEVTTDQRLREMFCGQIEGTTLEERVAKWGEDWSQLDLGVETHQQIAARGVSFIQDVIERHPNQKVLIVSHGALLSLTLMDLIPHENIEAHIHNTSVTTLQHINSRWECLKYNCISHLDGLAPETV